MVRKEVISCTNCQLCYDNKMNPTFCQEYSCNIDDDNKHKALKCDYFVPYPKIVDRYNFHVIAQERKRWYEKLD